MLILTIVWAMWNNLLGKIARNLDRQKVEHDQWVHEQYPWRLKQDSVLPILLLTLSINKQGYPTLHSWNMKDGGRLHLKRACAYFWVARERHYRTKKEFESLNKCYAKDSENWTSPENVTLRLCDRLDSSKPPRLENCLWPLLTLNWYEWFGDEPKKESKFYHQVLRRPHKCKTPRG